MKELNNKIIVDKFLPNINIRDHGLAPGDIIMEIDGESIENLSLEEVQSKFLGKKGTKNSIDISLCACLKDFVWFTQNFVFDKINRVLNNYYRNDKSIRSNFIYT